MTSSIGIGYGVDRKLVKGIAKNGNGFYDLVLNGDDMREKVINQLSQVYTGHISAKIFIENHEDIEIIPKPTNIRFSPGSSITLFIKSLSTPFDQTNHALIEYDNNKDNNNDNNNKKQFIDSLDIKYNEKHPEIENIIKMLFINKEIQELTVLNDKATEKTIVQLSLESGILSKYTGLIGRRIEPFTNEEKERILKMEQEYQNSIIKLTVITISGRRHLFEMEPNSTVFDIKIKLESIEGISRYQP